ncbi:dihydrofolate reductase family protein [Leifsonia xyli]|uniref:dihydrofolate reductase family protein n=1 Tax=Leifsonia xyli TaxID=1575 RepID=UPI003D67B0A4
MGVSADGFIADDAGGFDFAAPLDEQFRFQLRQLRKLGCYMVGRRLYEAMRAWGTDAAGGLPAVDPAFVEAWEALPKVVFSRTLKSVEGNARLAHGSVGEEVSAALRDARGDVAIGGANLAAEAIRLDLVDEFRLLRYPVAVGNGIRFWPPFENRLPLTLVATRAFGGRVVYEGYRRLRYEEPLRR